jgi:N-acetylglucosamine-6-phosphate deacetylase
VEDRKGSIEAGKDADLVVMDEDLEVAMVIQGGEVVYDADGLVGEGVSAAN